jgi:hypothetical protein
MLTRRLRFDLEIFRIYVVGGTRPTLALHGWQPDDFFRHATLDTCQRSQAEGCAMFVRPFGVLSEILQRLDRTQGNPNLGGAIFSEVA